MTPPKPYKIVFSNVPHRTFRILLGLSWPRYVALIARARIAHIFKSRRNDA